MSFSPETSLYIDITSTEALQVRKNGDTGDVLTVDTTNTNIKLGPGEGVINNLLSLYGTTTNISLGPHILATTTEDIYPVFQNFNWSHDNIALNFDMYYDGSAFRSSDIGSNFQIYKNSDSLKFNAITGIAAGNVMASQPTAMSISNTGNISIPTTTSIGATVNPTSVSGGALNLSGDLVMDSSKTLLFTDTGGIGVGSPTFTNRSSGAKIVLYPSITGSTTDFAIGIDSGTLWSSLANDTNSFKWYGGTTLLMSLTGTGLTLETSQIIDTTSTEALLVRKDGDGGDVFTIDTSTSTGIMTGGLAIRGNSRSLVDTYELALGQVINPTNNLNGSSLIRSIKTGVYSSYLEFHTHVEVDSALTSVALTLDASQNALFHRNVTIDNTSTEVLLVRKEADGGDVFTVDTTNSQVKSTTLLPLVTETYDLGSTSFEWNNIYSQNAVTVSDRNKKENIISERFGLDFVNGLNPVEFNYKSNGQKAHGLISQEVEDLLLSQGIDTQEFYSKETTDDVTNYHINYTHLIGPLIKSIQELSKRLLELEKK